MLVAQYNLFNEAGEIEHVFEKRGPQYRHPESRVGVAMLAVRDNKVLLGLRKNQAIGDALWACPGGKLDLYEDPKDAAIREFKEETGIEVQSATLVGYSNGVYKGVKSHFVMLFFSALHFTGVAVNMEPNKCERLEWIDLENLPENLMDTCREGIKMRDFHRCM